LPQYGQGENFLIVDKISITGNKVTKEKIILRELTFSPGDTIQKSKIMGELAESKNNLQNTLLFNFVYMDFMPEGNRIEVRIQVVERWYIWPIPIFEHAERNLPSWLKDPEFEKLNYGLLLNWNNFRGRNETLQLKARLGYKEQFGIGYNIPYFDKEQKHGLNIGVNRFRQNEVIWRTEDNQPVFLNDGDGYINRSFSTNISYSYRPKYYLRQSASISYSRLYFGADSLRDEYMGNHDIGTSQWFSAVYNIEYDNRDYKVYPLDGYYFRFTFLRRGLGIMKDFDYGKTYLTLVGGHHRKIVNRLYFENVAKVRLTPDEYLPFIFRQALGYDTNIRGFEFYLVDGNSYFVSANNLKLNLLEKHTFKLPLIPWEQFNKIHFSLFSNLFLDMGYVQGEFYNINGNDLTNKFIWSTGLGLDLLTYYDQAYRLEFTYNSLGDFGVFLHMETPFRKW
jgi:outer membrane protein assembly factor BamA